ncbi:adenylate kinase-domain-containing protein [Phlyctochytrium arcticum]|nr:adenylate kinase-domain-containing protein [Phlyctochytrium arcticum]
MDHDARTDAASYFERHRIHQVLESIVTGLTFTRPDDPLSYIESCIGRIRQSDLLSANQKLKWDVFIPPPAHAAQQLQQPTPTKRSKAGSDPRAQPPPLRKKQAGPGPLPPVQQTVAKEIPHPAPTTTAASAPPANFAAVPGELASDMTGPAWDNIVFVLGGPGCGKGTQCVRIARDYNYAHLSAGDLLRAEVATGSELGKELEQIMKEGGIVPMETTLRLLRNAMYLAALATPPPAGFLVDGFPRQLDQSIAFETHLRPCKFALFFDCPEDVLIKRLLKRGETSGRGDDNMETIRKRLVTFMNASMPVVEAFRKNNKCITISTEPSPDEVYNTVKKHFETPVPINHPNVVFVLGGPGSGKGTQCTRLAAEFGLTHLSSGDLLRAEITNKTAIGTEVEGIMREGKMVPMTLDQIHLASLSVGFIEQNTGSDKFKLTIILDGFPRAMSQAIEFEQSIGPCRKVLYFTCTLPTLEARLLERGKTSGRVDDNMETIRKRFRTFEEESMEVIEYFKTRGKVAEISAERAVEDVYQDARRIFMLPEPLNHPNVVFILGGPGSGKGTQCARLSKDYNLMHISTGDLLRAQVAQSTPIGLRAAKIMLEGGMVPLDLMMGLLVKEIEEKFDAKGFLIDGFPRSVEQTLEFERTVGNPRLVLSFTCPLSVLEQRLLERGKTSGRADDQLETIKARFVTYQKESMPVVEFYKRKGNVIEVRPIPQAPITDADILLDFFRCTDRRGL